jgi:hypothetical protein
MQTRFVPTWLGLVTLGSLVTGCPSDDAAGDEVDESGSTSESGTGESGSTSESGTSESGTSESGTSETGTSESGSTSESGTSETDTSTSDTSDTSDTETTGGGAFELVAAELTVDASTLILTFSDEVAAVDGVDPLDFKISYAWTYSVMYQYLYEMSYYIDPNYVTEMTVQMVGISNGPNPEQISLDLSPAVDLGICTIIQDYIDGAALGMMADAALFPHYSPGATPVTSSGGVELAPIGPEWVEVDNYYLLIEEYHWPNLDPQVAIPCMP